jgi:hypothetical protein
LRKLLPRVPESAPSTPFLRSDIHVRISDDAEGGARTTDDVTSLLITKLRTDGDTQCRHGLNALIVAEYAERMISGVRFPPVEVWFDGEHYWLTDGFHRLAAAKEAAREAIDAIVRYGSVVDARWSACAANAHHGLRRSKSDLENAITRALTHEHATCLTNVQVARHLGIPEPTLRRWRKRLGLATNNNLRTVVRQGKSYTLNTAGISGRKRVSTAQKTKSQLKAELQQIKALAQPNAVRLFLIIEKWLFAGANVNECVTAIERLWPGHSRVPAGRPPGAPEQ